jgi:LysR family glycine cleavage system transcriptional activator
MTLISQIRRNLLCRIGIVSSKEVYENRFIIAFMSENKSQIMQAFPRLPPLNAFKVFEVAARLQSFVKAGQELCVTHGAVSRQVKQLESALGIALFERRNRAVFLTPQGHMLLTACQEMLRNLSQSIDDIRAQDKALLPLVLSCEPTIAIRWLVPRLPDFRAHYPQYEIHLLTAGGRVDFARHHVDLALRRNDFHWGMQCHVESVAQEMVGPVCTPAVWNKITNSIPVRLLHARTRPEAWRQWSALSSQKIASDGAEQYEHFYLSLQAATSGLGVAIASEFMVESDLQDGRLVAPFGFITDGSEYVILSPLPVHQDARRIALLNWFRDAMGSVHSQL